VIDAYYGFPNLWTSILKTSVKNSNTTVSEADIKISSLGPLGGRVEYLLSEKIGFGLDFSYANTTAKYSDTYSTYNYSTGTYTTNTYDYEVSIPRWRLVPRINIHLGQSTKFDPYFAFGVGYANSKISATSNDPNDPGVTLSRSFIPVSVMAKFGMRYFITDNIGLGVETGIGGPLATAGVTFKF
jgi:hypothetical protein